MKIRTLVPALAAFATVFAFQPAFAQTNMTDDTQLLISQIQADKAKIVLSSMNLSEAETKAFVPVYDAYQADRKGIMQRSSDLLNKYAANYDSMTDDAAKGILKDWVKLQDDDAALMREYIKKLDKVLPTSKVLRFVQIENKLNALLRAEAAGIVPLATSAIK